MSRSRPFESRPCESGRRLSVAVIGVLAMSALCLLVGCGTDGSIDSTYGRRKGGLGARSVNGTGVFADMFEAAGYKVRTWRRLSPRIDEFDVLVWAPDGFDPPSKEQRERLELWLDNHPSRTLIYIGRDYDATIAYWEHARQVAPPSQAMEVNRRLAKARTAHATLRSATPTKASSRWFVFHGGGKRRRANNLHSPVGNWTRGIDLSKIEIELASRLAKTTTADLATPSRQDLPAKSEVLLAAGADPLVLRVSEGVKHGQLLAVANGSFVFNLPLVNHQHRKLAGRLIAECGDAQSVAFLEAGFGGLQVYEHEPGTNYPTGLEALTVWPLGAIVMHSMVLLIVYCFSIAATFGRPRQLLEDVAEAARAATNQIVVKIMGRQFTAATTKRRSRGDFGVHIDALGALLERTGDHGYAKARLEHYHRVVKRDSGVSHAEEDQAAATASAGGSTPGSPSVPVPPGATPPAAAPPATTTPGPSGSATGGAAAAGGPSTPAGPVSPADNPYIVRPK